MFLGKDPLKICSIFTGEHPYRSVISINLLCNFIEIVLRHGCSPVYLRHIFRTPFPKNASEHGCVCRVEFHIGMSLSLNLNRKLTVTSNKQQQKFLRFLSLGLEGRETLKYRCVCLTPCGKV